MSPEAPRRTWIAWETQRRSLEMARRLGADLKLFLHGGALRYPRSLAGTAALLAGRRGRTVFVQNPSMLLAAWAGVLRGPFGYRLVVDRHSNFAHLAGKGAGLKRRLSDLLSDFTLRRADLTIVTNAQLARHVELAGGRPFILPDPFPDLSPLRAEADAFALRPDDGQPCEILFVSSWAFDEPIEAAVEAARRLRGEAIIRVSGRAPARYASLLRDAPDNFIPTGFLPEAEYLARLARSDAVMAVTSRAATLVCGGYEGAALGKPLILGDSEALRAYFDAGAVYTDGTARDLEHQIRNLITALPAYREGIKAWHARKSAEWDGRLAALEGVLAGMESEAVVASESPVAMAS